MHAIKPTMPRKTGAQAFAVDGIALFALSAISQAATVRHEEYRPGFCDRQNLFGIGSGGALVI